MLENSDFSKNKIMRAINIGGVAWFEKNGKKLIFILVAIAIIIAFLTSRSQEKEIQEQADNKVIGLTYTHIYNKDYVKAEKELEKLLNKDITGLLLNKVYLLYANVLYEQKKYEKAFSYYKKVKLNAQDFPLFQGGADFGKAVTLMQLGKYEEAAENLELYINTYKLANTSKQDVVPNIADALWKQALCYSQLQKKDKIQGILDILKRDYFKSQEKKFVEKLLAVLG